MTNELGNKELMAQNIKRYMDAKGISRNELCKALGFNYSTLSDWLHARKYPRIDKIERMANYFGISKSDLVEASDPILSLPNIVTQRGKPVPIIGTIAAGVPILADENIEGYAVPADRVRSDFALRVKGDSMINVPILDGDIVFIRKQPQVENGEIAAVVIDGEATLKRVYIENGSVMLVAENPQYRPMIYTAENCDDLRIIGKAVAYQHSLVYGEDEE